MMAASSSSKLGVQVELEVYGVYYGVEDGGFVRGGYGTCVVKRGEGQRPRVGRSHHHKPEVLE